MYRFNAQDDSIPFAQSDFDLELPNPAPASTFEPVSNTLPADTFEPVSNTLPVYNPEPVNSTLPPDNPEPGNSTRILGKTLLEEKTYPKIEPTIVEDVPLAIALESTIDQPKQALDTTLLAPGKEVLPHQEEVINLALNQYQVTISVKPAPYNGQDILPAPGL
jgi:hypothetical protein